MSVDIEAESSVRAAHLGPERRRPQVLDAALQLSLRGGTRGLSMDAIAQQLEVSRPVVYSCYPSREALLNALLEREEQRLFDGVMAALPATADFSRPEKVMAEGFQALLTVVSEHEASWKLVFATDPDPLVAERYGDARARVACRVGELMAPALQMAGVEDIPRKLPILVELFMSIGDSAVRSLIENRPQWTPDELGAYIGQLTLGALQRA